MKILKVIYYNSYLFYKRILKEDDPHFTTVLALSFLFSVYTFSVFDIFLSLIFRQRTSLIFNICQWIIITLIMYILFLYKNKGEYIVKKEKPILYNQQVSRIVTIIFFIGGIILIFFERWFIHKISGL